MRHLLLILTLTLLLLAGCRHAATNPAIQRAEQLADTLPAQTLAILDSIPAASLTGHDLFLHQFLTIKARDKQFITHTSDSLLLLALDYAEDHRSTVNYPEVLYYAGRVYSDIGDYPTALDYYHQALDEIPENQELKLRAKILSNIGHIHKKCCLYDEGIKAYQEAVCIDSVCCSTLNMLYDLIDLGDIYLCKDMFSDAERYYKRASGLSDSYPMIKIEQNVNLARVYLFSNRIDSAIILISNTANNVEPGIRNHALATAAEIYRYANVPDSARYYANELLKSSYPENVFRGYNVLLSDSLRSGLNTDSIESYLRKYTNSVNTILNENSKKEILIRNAQYNYSIQQRERIKAENDRRMLTNWLIVAITIILVTLSVILFLRLKSNRQLLKLHEAEENIKLLTAEISRHEESARKNLKPGILEQRKLLKEQLLEEVKKLVDKKKFSHEQDFLINDPAYSALIQYMERKETIADDSPLWKELLDGISRVSPNFSRNLELLVGEPLKNNDLHTAILIKYGITPTSISKILGRSKQAINSRREKLGIKIFGESVRISEVDALIRAL